MSDSEMSRIVMLRQVDGKPIRIEASPEERAALAGRFGILSVERLEAEMTLKRDGKEVAAEGNLVADVVQTCGVSDEGFAVHIAEPVSLRFVPEVARRETDEEVELDEGDLDEIEYSGAAFDLGEAIAQTLGLAIDPYAAGPNADAARKNAGLADEDTPSGPLAEALRGLTSAKDS